MINLENKTVLVTGGSSMIGRSIIKKLKKRNCKILNPSHKSLDLLDYNKTLKYFLKHKPDYVIHAAGYNGNISFNKLYPRDIFYRTSVMGLNTLLAASETGCGKIVSLLASCAYESTTDELKEENFLNGQPDASVEAHGLGKRNLFIMSKQISKQTGMLAVCTIFNTAYGPHDNYNIEKTKVVGGLITKYLNAVEDGQDNVVCWGTGNPKRELIYCDDAAEGVIQTLEKYDNVNLPINIGFNKEYTIKELADKISSCVGYTGKTTWDTTKPDGQMRKILDSSRMAEFNIEIRRTSLENGLKKTIKWVKKVNQNK